MVPERPSCRSWEAVIEENKSVTTVPISTETAHCCDSSSLICAQHHCSFEAGWAKWDNATACCAVRFADQRAEASCGYFIRSSGWMLTMLAMCWATGGLVKVRRCRCNMRSAREFDNVEVLPLCQARTAIAAQSLQTRPHSASRSWYASHHLEMQNQVDGV